MRQSPNMVQKQRTIDAVEPTTGVSQDRMSLITTHPTKFLRFLEPRVGDLATADDILQSACIKAMERGSQIRE